MVRDGSEAAWREPYPEEKAAAMGHSPQLFQSGQLMDDDKTALVGLAWDMFLLPPC
jgi:hypothetical protein